MILFENKKDCCACGACLNICPKSAISMQEDEYGFVYPVIDHEKCVRCGLCKKVCSFTGSELPKTDPVVYAASLNNDDIIMKSASGGMFAALAADVLEHGGAVFGAELKRENDRFIAEHTYIRDVSQLHRLQGSKYVQSSTGLAYRQVRSFLEEGTKVLYSGTPCQIDGLYGFLGKNYNNLITADIICQGVPNLTLFNDYIRYYEKKLGGKITGYRFRDKKYGQGKTQAFSVLKNGEEKTVRKLGDIVSYIYEFQKGNICRENCYRCRYACRTRVSDITIGDYWGVYNEHEEDVKRLKMSDKKGISCLILNTQKGKECFEAIKPKLKYFVSDIDKAARYNGRLNYPTKRTNRRDAFMEAYKNDGYEGFERLYRKDNKMRLFYSLKRFIPVGLKHRLKKMKKK